MLTSVYMMTGWELVAWAVVVALFSAAATIILPLSLGAIEDGR